jgi:hypothetical protein
VIVCEQDVFGLLVLLCRDFISIYFPLSTVSSEYTPFEHVLEDTFMLLKSNLLKVGGLLIIVFLLHHLAKGHENAE